MANNQFRLEFFQKEPVGGKVAPTEYDLYMADKSGAAVSEVRKFVAWRREFRIDIAFANQFEVSAHVKDTRSAVLKGLRSNLSVPDAINYEERY